MLLFNKLSYSYLHPESVLLVGNVSAERLFSHICSQIVQRDELVDECLKQQGQGRLFIDDVFSEDANLILVVAHKPLL